TFDCSCRIWRDKSLENARAAGRRNLSDVDVVFYGDRNAEQRVDLLARGDSSVETAGVLECAVASQCDKGMNGRVDPVDLFVNVADDFADGEVAIAIERNQFVCRNAAEIHLRLR